jgi:hypothetical protein
MDNCAIHHGDEISELFESHGQSCQVLQLIVFILILFMLKLERMSYRISSTLLPRLQSNRTILLVLESLHQERTRIRVFAQSHR